VIFQPYIKAEVGTARAPRQLSIAGVGHRVTVQAGEYVARCGARFDVASDGALFQVPALFRESRCEACEAATS
jgi:hypothetical protein